MYATVSRMAENMATKAELASLSATVSHLATKAELSSVSATVSHMAANMATKADLAHLESSLIKWTVGTLLTVAVLTLTIARFVKFGG